MLSRITYLARAHPIPHTASCKQPPSGTRVISSYRLTTIEEASIDQAAIVDTTGAGDAFIGTMLFSVAMGLPPVRGATLASVVAAAKCRKLGARPGLVRLDEIDGALELLAM